MKLISKQNLSKKFTKNYRKEKKGIYRTGILSPSLFVIFNPTTVSISRAVIQGVIYPRQANIFRSMQFHVE